ncbi:MULTISPECIES: cell division site-positioning protein MapZ family protein [Aerococcus]
MHKRFFKDNRQIAYVLMGIVVCVAALFIIRAFANTNRMSAEEKIEAVASSVNALYYDNSYTFLKTDIQQDEISELTEEVDNLRDSEEKPVIEERITSVQQRFDLQNQLNGLFDENDDGSGQAVINGATIQEYFLVDDDVTIDELDVLRENYANQLDNEDDGFYNTATTLIDEAESQINLIRAYASDLTAIEHDTTLTYDTLEDQLTTVTERVNEIENPCIQDRLLEMIAKSDEKATQAIFNRLVEEAEAADQSDEALAKIREEGQAAIKASKSRVADLTAIREEIMASNDASATLTLRRTSDKPSFGVNTNVTSGVLASKHSGQSTSRSSSRRSSSPSSQRPVSSSSIADGSSSSESSSSSSSAVSSDDNSSSSTSSDASSSEEVPSSASSSSSDASSVSSSSSSSSVASSSDSTSSSTSSSNDSASTSSDSSSSSASESSRDDSDIEDGAESDSSQMNEPSSSSSSGSVIEDSATSSSSQQQSTVESNTTERPRSSVASDSVTESSQIPYGSPE